MVKIVKVTQEIDKDGKPVVRFDPRRGLSDYTVYVLETQYTMLKREYGAVCNEVARRLRFADYEGHPVLALVAKQPIACYVKDSNHLGLVLFSHFTAEEVMEALESGKKNIEAGPHDVMQDADEFDVYCHC